MKSLYWRPQKVSRGLLLSVCVLSLLGLWLVETCPVPRYDRTHALKIRAAERAQKLMAAVREERLRRGLTINSHFDPANTGLIGEPMSLVTTRPGDLRAKQTSCNPNFAAAVVQLLDQAGVRPGDTVAIGWSGSFPAMNLAVCAAVETMELRPIVLASATASQYGANHPEFFWLDMEHSLRQQQLVCLRSAAVSLGGAADRGWGLPSEAVSCIRAAIKRNGVPELGASSRAEAVQRRMQTYRELAAGHPIKAYINVGGGVASTGGESAKQLYRAGLNWHLKRSGEPVDCVMTRFASQGCPVIHLVEIRQLAEQYGFPLAPRSPPAAGQGKPFHPVGPRRAWATIELLAILLMLRGCVSTGLSHRIRSGLARWLPQGFAGRLPSGGSRAAEPQLMV